MSINVYPYIQHYVGAIPANIVTKIEDETVTYEELRFSRLEARTRFRRILSMTSRSLKEKKIVLVNTNSLYRFLSSEGYSVALFDEYKGKAEYYVVLPGEEIKTDREIKCKYIVWAVFYDHPLASVITRLRYDVVASSFPSQEDVEKKLQSYWIIDEKKSPIEAIYVMRLKPEIPPYIDNQLLYLKEMFLSGRGKSNLNIEYSIGRVEYVLFVNYYLSFLLQKWSKKPTLKHWKKIMESIDLDS